MPRKAENAFRAWLPFFTAKNLAERVEKSLHFWQNHRDQMGLKSLTVEVLKHCRQPSSRLRPTSAMR